jgi:hypothetical protein
MMRKITLALPILGLITTLAMSSPALADGIGLSLANPVQVTGPGSTLSFVATVSAPLSNLADVFLNSDSTNVDFPLTLDDSPFILNFPLFLAPGGSFTGDLFTVAVPTFAAFGQYQGFFEIEGGADNGASNLLASVNFQVTNAPEPGGIVLLLIGLTGLAVALRRKYRLN